jgi:uncharacterized delta-60 repeat protein
MNYKIIVFSSLTSYLFTGCSLSFKVAGNEGYALQCPPNLTPAVFNQQNVDTSFGTNGYDVLTNSSGPWAFQSQSNGEVLEAFGGSIPLVFSELETNGSLDSNFASPSVSVPNQPLDVEFGPDGDTYVLMQATNGEAIQVQRIIAETPDATYGTDGVSSFEIPNFGSAIALSLTFTNDGKVLVQGVIPTSSSSDSSEAYGAFFLIRLLSTGLPDSNFGNGGIVMMQINAPGSFTGNGIVVGSDNSIYIAGRPFLGSSSTGTTLNGIAIIHLNIDGSIDSSFGTNGQVFTSINSGIITPESVRIALQSNGDIIAGATAQTPCFPNNDGDFLVARYSASGALDMSFGNNGFMLSDFGSDSSFQGILVLSDNRVVAYGVGGNPTDNGYPPELARYTSTGQPDTSFGGTGEVVMNMAGIIESYLALPNNQVLLSVYNDTNSSTPTATIFRLLQ